MAIHGSGRIQRQPLEASAFDEVWYCDECARQGGERVFIRPLGMLFVFGKLVGECPLCGKIFAYHIEGGLLQADYLPQDIPRARGH